MVQLSKVLHPTYITFLLLCIVWLWKILNAPFSAWWFLHQVKILNRYKSQRNQILVILFWWWNLQITNSGEARRKENKEIPRAYREGRWKTQYCKGNGCHKKDGALLVFHLTHDAKWDWSWALVPALLSLFTPCPPYFFYNIFIVLQNVLPCDILRPAHGPSSSLLVASLLYILLVNFSLNSSSFFLLPCYLLIIHMCLYSQI